MRKGNQLGEKEIEFIFEKGIVFPEICDRFIHFILERNPFGQTGERPTDTFNCTVIQQPVPFYHKRKEIIDSFRQDFAVFFDGTIGLMGILFEALFRISGEITGQEVIVVQIDDYSGVLTVFWPESVFAKTGDGMVISVFINLPVQFDAATDPVGIVEFLPAFDKISDEIADHQFLVVTGQIDMREEIHRITNKRV